MKTGILGGTFDPPHVGHLTLARSARDQLELDEVLFVPANRNPLKDPRKTTPARSRLDMVKLAIHDEEKMAVSDIEIVRGGASYMLDTVSELTHLNPSDYWLVLGADSVKTITEWKQPEKLIKMCRLAVALRGGQGKEDVLARIPEVFHERIDWLDMPLVDISATTLRHKIDIGQPISPWVKSQVIAYIEKNRLYRR